jgi:two-component system cell cycle response regulator
MEKEVGSLSYWQKNRDSHAARILVIEDHPANMELMVYVLTAFGYVTDTAANGREGIDRVTQEAPDLIICDLEMPVLDGYGFALELKGNAAFKQIPLIAVTANAMVGDSEKILAAGFDGYISKPISPEKIVRQIEAFLPESKRNSKVPEGSPDVASPATVGQPTRGKILVLDDSAASRDLMCDTLGPCGYTVVATDRVAEALEHVARDTFDLILSDVHMPETNGVEFLKIVKGDPKLRSIPFILFTASYSGLSTSQVETLARDLGAEFMNIPIEATMLLSIVDRILRVDRGTR